MISYRRIYENTVKKHAVKASLVGISLIFAMFILMSDRGDITITGYSGDILCAGTIDEPCFAYLNFTANTDIYIYPTNETTWAFDVSPEHLMKEIVMQRSWGKSWRTIDLSKSWSSKVKYAIKFSSGKNYSLRFIGYKNNINDTVKWGFGTNDSYIDPAWIGYTADDFIPTLLYNRADITSGEAEFEVCNPTSFDIKIDNKNLKFHFNKVKGDLKTFEAFVGTRTNITETRSIWISNISIVEKTNSNGTKYTESIDNGHYEYYDETVEKTDYNPLDNSIKKLNPNECKTIRIKGTWEVPYKNEISIDWIPEIEIEKVKFKQIKFAWWNNSWSKTKRITITNTSELVGYQLRMVVPYDSDMNTTYKDIRFTYDDNTTVLPYWIESYNTTEVRVWINTSQSSVNMWYGNPSVSSTSNISSTFIFGDGFDDGVINPSWTWTNNSNANNEYLENTPTGKMNITTASSDAWGAAFSIPILSISAPSFDYEVIGEVNWSSVANYEMAGLIAWSDGNNWYRMGKGYHSGYGNAHVHMAQEVSGTNSESGSISYTDDLVYLALRKEGGVHKSFYSDNQTTWYWFGLNTTVTTDKIGIHALKTTAGKKSGFFDNFRIRRYLDPAPTYVISSEESKEDGSITIYFNGTSDDRFYELGDSINITVCSNISETVFINSDHPDIGNGTSINGTNCTTYIWNTSFVEINSFNDSTTEQNYTANNITYFTINNISEISNSELTIEGLGKGNTVIYEFIDSSDSYNFSTVTNSATYDMDNVSFAFDNDWGSASKSNCSAPCSVSYFNTTTVENWTATDDIYDFEFIMKSKSNLFTNLTFWAWNYTGSSWKLLSTYSTDASSFNRSGNTVGLDTNDLKSGRTIRTRYIIECVGTPCEIYESAVNFTYNETTYPFNLTIDVGDDGIKDYWMPYSYLNGTYGVSKVFKTNEKLKNLTFLRSGTNVTYVDLPCGATANSMTFNVSGGSSTQNLKTIDNKATPQYYVFSTENSSKTVYFHIPLGSTVQESPVNITLTGNPYYSSAGTLSGGHNTPQYGHSGVYYKKTASKSYDGTGIYLYGAYRLAGLCNTYALTLTLKGDSGTKATCTSSPGYFCGLEYIYYSCNVNVNTIQPNEDVWVEVSSSPSTPYGPMCGSDCTGSAFHATYFSGLNQYDKKNATNITVWYNGSTQEYQYLPELNSSVTLNVNLSSTNMNNYLSSCTDNPCLVPYAIKTNKMGNITVSNVDIDYINSISNITFDVGNDGVKDGGISGITISNNNITLNATGLNAINTYMSGTCLNKSLPIVSTSETAGTMSLSNLLLNYSINPISLNTSAITDYMSGNTGDVDIPISFSSDNWGILNLNSLSINLFTDYNYSFTGWSTNSVSNMTKLVKLIWSNFSRSFSRNTKEPIFIGKFNQTQNITPYGQTNLIPGINFSYLAREQCMNISAYTNESLNTCMNLTISATSNKSDGFFFNTTQTYFLTNLCNGTAGMWLFLDIDSSCARQTRPYINYRSKCVSCV